MSRPQDLERGDEVQFDCEGLEDAVFEVSDTDTEDIGLTVAYAVLLVSEYGGGWTLTGTASSDMATLSELDGDREYSPLFDEIEKA